MANISTKITGLNIIIFIVLGLSILYVRGLMLESEVLQKELSKQQDINIRVAWSAVEQLGDNFYIQGDKLYAGDHVLNNNNELVDKIKDIVGGTATIFMGDLRVATNVIKEDGNRAIGTRLARGPVYDSIFRDGKPYRGENVLFGNTFVTAYDPIKNAEGDVIGILYVGLDKDEFFAPYENIISGIIIIIAGFGLILFILNYLLVRNFVAIPLQQACSIIESMSKGYLDIDLFESEGDEIGELFNSFHRMQMLLKDIIRRITSDAYKVSQTSNQVLQGNSELGNRTQQQASNLEEISSTMEEMTSTVQQTADNAVHADKLSVEARKQAEKGGEVTNRAVEAMEMISKSSKKISDIINVIEDIAFQTNLLALNAAVEASRAGEHGRGFGVVADEVRSLSKRCKSAANEIKELINNSVSMIEDGTKLVNDSKTSLDEIIQAVKNVSDIVNEISVASQQQANGINQVNISITQIDEMTQHNASLVEQASAASEAMGIQAEDLNTLVKFFKLKESELEYIESIESDNKSIITV